jgi:hypothetical protein
MLETQSFFVVGELGGQIIISGGHDGSKNDWVGKLSSLGSAPSVPKHLTLAGSVTRRPHEPIHPGHLDRTRIEERLPGEPQTMVCIPSANGVVVLGFTEPIF